MKRYVCGLSQASSSHVEGLPDGLFLVRVARAQVQAPAGEAERLAREAVALAAPNDFLDLQATALLALARVLSGAESAEAAGVAAEAQAVYELKGNVVGAGWAKQLLETAPPQE